MDAAEARDLLETERTRLQRLHEEQQSSGFGLSAGDTAAGGGLNDKLGGDAATQIADREMAQSIDGHLEAELAEVEAALQRVEDGTYGVCEVTGEPIDDERLRILPATRYSAAAAPQAERARGTEDRGTGGLTADLEQQRRDPS
jgi:DnaK suppressor protein